MDRSLKISLIAAVIAVLTTAQGFGAQKSPADPEQSFRGLPLVFEPNHGQAPPDVRFVSRRGGLATSILDDGLLVRAGSGGPLGIRLMGSSPPSSVVGADPTGGVSNYYRGRDTNHWHEGVPHYRRVVINDVYAGVNLVYYGNGGQLEFDFEVSPGTTPEKILMAVEGAIGLDATDDGAFRLRTGEGDFQLHRPTVYQWVGSERVEIASSFHLADDNLLAFEIGAYDETQPLIIDPILEYATFLGGQEDDLIHAATTDSDGNAYLTGSTNGFTYPARNGFDITFDRHMDAVITKLNPEGTKIIFSTFLGADDTEEGHAITLDADRNVFVAGYTEIVGTGGLDFPTTPGVLDDTIGGTRDAWIAKISATGGTLEFATLLGATREDIAKALRVDEAGNIHVVGETGGSFMTTPGAFDRIFGGGGTDLFYVKLNPDASELLYSTYIGGSGPESGPSIQLDEMGYLYLAATSPSIDLQTTPGAFQKKRSGGSDVFVLKMNSEGDPPEYWTYLGGNQEEGNVSLALDPLRNLYLTGRTESTAFPVTEDALFPTIGGSRDAFVTKLDMTASELLYSTFIGGSDADSGAGIVVDPEGSILFAGSTSSPDFPTTAEAQDSTYGGGQNIFIAKLTSSGDRLLYSSYFGGGNNLTVAPNSLFLDSLERTVVAGTFEFSGAEDFPSTPNSLRPIRPLGQYNGFVTKFDLSEFSGTPQIAAGGIVGAGLSIPPVRAISPNGIFTIYGSVFAEPGTFVQVSPADLVDGKVPTRLAGVCVEASGTRLPMFAVTRTQLNVQAASILPPGFAEITVIRDCDGPAEARSNVETIATAAASPEFFFFAFNDNGVNPIAAQNILTGELIGPPGLFGKGAPPPPTTVPAYHREFIVFYGTGFGLTDPPFEAGELPDQAATVLLPPKITIGGVEMRPRDMPYVGVTPGSAGLYQFNVEIRALIPQGNQPVKLELGDTATPPGGFIPVEPVPLATP